MTFKKKIYVLFFLLGISYLFYKSFIRSGFNQILIIEDSEWGIERRVIPPESYAFIFRNVIPNRIRLHSLQNQFLTLKFTYFYPLSVNPILGLDESFSVKLDLVYIYNIDLENVVDLFMKLSKKNQEGLDDYLKIRLNDLLYHSLKEKLKIEENLFNGEAILKNYFHNGFLQEVNEIFKNEGIYFTRVYIQDIYVPDGEQYKIVLQESKKFLEKKLERSALIDEAKAEKESKLILFEYEKKRLEDLANLIRKYPEIQEFLKIEKISSEAKFIYFPTELFWNHSSMIKKILPENPKTESKELQIKKFLDLEKNQKPFIDKTPP